MKGVLERFENRVVKYDKRNRKATFEITICNEKKEVQLSIQLTDDSQKTAEAGKDGQQEAAMPVLKEAT